MSETKQCNECGILYNSEEGKYGMCGDCTRDDAKLFSKVNKNISYGESLTAEQISTKTGVELRKVNQWIVQGRFDGFIATDGDRFVI